jgi:hypothetical protein
MMKARQGKVWAESEMGSESGIRFRLPIQEPAVPHLSKCLLLLQRVGRSRNMHCMFEVSPMHQANLMFSQTGLLGG